jgi:hypothetical protein
MVIRVLRNQDKQITGVVIISTKPDKDKPFLDSLYALVTQHAKTKFGFNMVNNDKAKRKR